YDHDRPGREAEPGTPMGQTAQHRDIDRAPHAQQIFDAEHHDREDVEGVEIGAVTGSDLANRVRGKGDGVEDDEDDEDGVDDAAGGVGVAPHFENIVDLTAPAPPH